MSESLTPVLFLVLVAAAFWLLIIRPARQRQRQQAELVASLRPGTRVLLGSGMIGEVVTLRDDDLDVRIAPDVVVTFVRQAVLRELPDEHDGQDEDQVGTQPAGEIASEGTPRDDASSG